MNNRYQFGQARPWFAKPGLGLCVPLGVLISIFFLLPSAATAQSAGKIVSQYQKALGGAALLKSLKTVDFQGHVTTGSDSGGTFTEDLQAPNRIYLEISLGSRRWSEAYNGKSAWILDSRSGLQTLTGARARDIQLAASILNRPLIDYRKQRIRLVVTGREPVRGEDAYVVEATTASGGKCKLWFEVANHLLVKEEIPAFYPPVFDARPASGSPPQNGAHGNSAPALDTISYADYRRVNGILEPFQIDVQRGSETFHIAIDRVRPNATLNAAVFNFPQSSSQPLPDIAALLRDVAANQKKIDQIVANYTYREQDTAFEIDKKGLKIKKSMQTYEVYHLGDREIRKLMMKDGKPLTPAAQKKEDSRVEKIVKDYQDKQAKEAAGDKKPRKNKDQTGISDFLRVDQFTDPRRERYRGQDVIVFDFGPRPGSKPHNAMERLLQDLAGVAWVDEKTRDIARLEAHMTGTWKFGGGLIASIRPGAYFVFEQQLVNNEVWLPSYTEAYVSAKVLLFAGVNANIISQFSDYKKFRVEAAEKVQKPAGRP
ncbi:MAG: hypothetical protein ACRD2O_06495 [Terriglobia bacterium]